MAKVTMTFTDDTHGMGTVEVVSSPTAGELLERLQTQGPEAISPAQQYALSCITHILQHAKEAGEMTPGPRKLILPGRFN